MTKIGKIEPRKGMKVHSSHLNGWVKVVVGNIVTMTVDVVVNAANSNLMGGGGVDGAIHAAGGPEILEACRKIREVQFPGGLPTGEAVATEAGKMPSRWVIHTVGPVFGEWQGREAEMLRSCYWNSLVLARKLGASTIAFPAISTGIYGYPRELAAGVVCKTLQDVQPMIPGIKHVILVFQNEDDAFLFSSNETFKRSST